MINSEQTIVIRNYLIEEGFTDHGLIDDLVDHISCEIESLQNKSALSFQEAFVNATGRILPNEPITVENDLKLLTTKTQHIMIRKLAFLGGYVSIVCLCLSVLFFVLSSTGSKKTALKTGAIQQEYLSKSTNGYDSWAESAESDELNKFVSQTMISAYKNYSRAENLLILSIILFMVTFLPYQFYAKYQKPALEVQHS